MALTLEKSSGNVFLDLGFDVEEAENLKLRANLMAKIRRYIKTNQLSQSEAAACFGVTQPRISNLMTGEIQLFTIDALVKMLAKAQIRVEVAFVSMNSEQ